ncbi:MAG: NAD-dependent epimerase/dehydratase family protein [Sulfuritalea sp.]|jgi:nucleoside-diphosphate-sugar epimerase|nr:NAD-dependent epimerase/dehydratase family protein [Sulfuritalea sp.]
MTAIGVDSIGSTPIACVTGATGMIGRRLVGKLLTLGYQVRVLTRRPYVNQQVRVFKGSLADEAELNEFICGADLVFNCAAELSDESKMWTVNALGTALITDLVDKHHIKYYCHLSSAGVVGRASQKFVDEDAPCQPQNRYEATKLDAEKFASRRIEGCNTIILRPTNVVDCEHLGELSLPLDGSIRSQLKAFVKGGECAHIVHAEDVADAALFFLERPPSPTPRLFFVSLDDDPLNTVSDLWSLFREMESGRKHSAATRLPHLPVIVPYALRLLAGRPGNSGDVKYSSKRLISEGFRYTFGVRETVAKIVLERNIDINGYRC